MGVAKVGGRSAKKSERGATAVEYALILAAIAAVVMLTVIGVGTHVKGWFSAAESQFPAGGVP